MKPSDEKIAKKIRKYGGDILCSPIFREGFHQTHHEITTVSEHILNVTIMAMKIAEKDHLRGIETDDRVLVIAALCHDLGIIGRYEKYKSNHETGQRHGPDSLDPARELVPELDPKTEDAIAHHMWPVTKKKPSSREGMLVLSADKLCATAEWMWFFSGYRWSREIKEYLVPNEGR